jgi:aryl-alcohol dehydrogenase-like predicted oxidoreductase
MDFRAGAANRKTAHATHPVTAIQNEYSLIWRGPEEVIISLCEELGNWLRLLGVRSV